MTTVGSSESPTNSMSSSSQLPKYQFKTSPNSKGSKLGLFKPGGNSSFEANHSQVNKTNMNDINFSFTSRKLQEQKKEESSLSSAYESNEKKNHILKTKVSNPELREQKRQDLNMQRVGSSHQIGYRYHLTKHFIPVFEKPSKKTQFSLNQSLRIKSQEDQIKQLQEELNEEIARSERLTQQNAELTRKAEESKNSQQTHLIKEKQQKMLAKIQRLQSSISSKEENIAQLEKKSVEFGKQKEEYLQIITSQQSTIAYKNSVIEQLKVKNVPITISEFRNINSQISQAFEVYQVHFEQQNRKLRSQMEEKDQILTKLQAQVSQLQYKNRFLAQEMEISKVKAESQKTNLLNKIQCLEYEVNIARDNNTNSEESA